MIQRICKSAISALAYFFILFIFFEMASRAILAIPPLFKKISGEDDASCRLKWVRRHGGRQEIYSRLDIYDPSRGWAVKPNLRDLVVFGGHLLNSNSRGIRGREEYSYDRVPGKLRIVFLGDSFTFGEEVSDDETIPAALQEMLPGAEVINLGVHGYGHDQMLIYLNEEGIRYRPDIVILVFVYVDLFRNLMAFKDYAKPRFVLEGDRLALAGSPVPPPSGLLRSEWRRSKFVDLLTILYHKILHATGVQLSRMERLTAAVLDGIIAAVRRAGGTPVFVYLPGGDEIKGVDGNTAWRESYFSDFCRGRGVAHFSVTPVFRESLERGVGFKTYGHFDAAGNLIAARAIRDYLFSQGLVEKLNTKDTKE